MIFTNWEKDSLGDKLKQITAYGLIILPVGYAVRGAYGFLSGDYNSVTDIFTDKETYELSLGLTLGVGIYHEGVCRFKHWSDKRKASKLEKIME